MEQEVKSYFDWVDSSVINDIETDFPATFCSSETQSALEIQRFCAKVVTEDEKVKSNVADTEPVSNVADLEHFAKLQDPCQIFLINQKHSYARLYITRGLFKQLLNRYTIFDRVWDFVLPFSFKTRESDIGHAPFRFRQSGAVLLEPSMRLGFFECAYGFRYVELNHRKGLGQDNPDYDPWSVRQTAVYQQYNSHINKLVFVLIAPSKKVRAELQLAVRRRLDHQAHLNAFDLHRIIISTLHENWRHYLRSLEKLIMHQSDRVVLTKIRSETERLSPLTDFAVNFVDRQRLKKIEDKILDLVIVFESLYDTLSKLQKQCRLHCAGPACKMCMCSRTIDEFEEQMHEAQVNLKKVEILHKRAQGTGHLLSDLLDYENAQIAHLNERSLNELAKESKDENSKMRVLSERSTRDAAAVRILTVITLIYLPMTVVLNFFSTQLVHVDENGNVSIIAQSWWFAVIAVPLTIATFAVWQLWLSYSIKSQTDKETDHLVEGDTGTSHTTFDYIRTWRSRRRSYSRRRRQRGILDTAPQNAVSHDPESKSPTSEMGYRKGE